MTKLMAGAMALAAAAVAGNTACIQSQEMDVLQSNALLQRLMVAAFDCDMRAEYTRFVEAFQPALLKADLSLEAFFMTGVRSENYHGFKTRIANEAALEAAHDNAFCRAAWRMMDVALAHAEDNPAWVPAPEEAIAIGYETCPPPEPGKPVEEAAKPTEDGTDER